MRLAIGMAFLGLATLCVACGAKTGLRIPDVVPPDVVDVVDACVPLQTPLLPRRAQVMFLIDRSGSMSLDIAGDMMPPSRWSVLGDALRTTLPAVQSAIDIGAVVFPRVVTDSGSIDQQCSVLGHADLLPGPNNANALLEILTTTQPAGGTPTYEALVSAHHVINMSAARGDARVMVLATDGGPNCNPALNSQTCVCTSSQAGVPDCASRMFPYNCLDDTRSIDEIASILHDGIPVYVIGIADLDQMGFADVLNSMAIAGGRPNAVGPESYYSVRSPADLSNAFTTIENAITRCSFVTPTPPMGGLDAATLLRGSQPVPRDTTRMNGWDWTDPTFGEVTLFGPACDAVVAMPTAQLTLTTMCN